MPSHFFNKIRTGVKTEQLKILTWPHRSSRGFLECAICQLIVFFTVKGNLFSFMARIRIPTVLRGHQYNYTETVPIGKANHHLFYLFMHSYVKGYSFLDGFLLGQRTYLVEKNVFTTWGTTSNFAIPAKEHFAFACAVLVVCQQPKLWFRWPVCYGPLWKMSESSSVIENDLNLLLKNLRR